MEKVEFPKKTVITPQESVGITLGTCSVPGSWCGQGISCGPEGVGCVGCGCN